MNDDLILRAARLAAIAHNGQMRKWSRLTVDPYILHPMRVAGLVALSLQSTPQMVAAAWLHDTLEDTELTEDDLVAKGFGGEVVYFVKQLTNASKLDAALKGKPRAERKAADRAKLANSCWEVQTIKLADRIDNLSEMAKCNAPADFAVLYKKESKQLLEVLRGTDAELEAQLENLIG